MRESPVKIHQRPAVEAPAHLTEGSRRLWERLATEYGLLDDGHALLLLTSALEARDRMAAARDRLDQEGVTVPDRTGGLKMHPCVMVERDSHARMLQSFKALRLDIEDVVLSRPGRKGR